MIRKSLILILLSLLLFLGNTSTVLSQNKNKSANKTFSSHLSKQNYEVIALKYSDAKGLIDNINRYIKYSSQNGSLSVDEASNSIVIQGNIRFITSIRSLIQKLDEPKHFYSFTLPDDQADKAYDVLKNHFHLDQNSQDQPANIDSLAQNTQLDQDTSGSFTLKCAIEKRDVIGRVADPPSINIDNKEHTISILGNRYQVESAKAIMLSLTSKQNSNSTSESSDKDSKEQDVLETQLNVLKSKLDTSLTELDEKNKQLVTSNKNIDTLNSQIRKLQSENLWNVLTPQKANYTLLKAENEKNKQEIASLKTIIDEKDKIIEEKEEELRSALSKIQEITSTSQVTTSKTSDNVDNNQTTNDKILVSTLSELSDLKTELKKTKQQLNNSKYQLELIFGGKLLDSIVMPNDKSGWFK